jgi:hypothetical protein
VPAQEPARVEAVQEDTSSNAAFPFSCEFVSSLELNQGSAEVTEAPKAFCVDENSPSIEQQDVSLNAAENGEQLVLSNLSMALAPVGTDGLVDLRAMRLHYTVVRFDQQSVLLQSVKNEGWPMTFSNGQDEYKAQMGVFRLSVACKPVPRC